MRHHSASRSAVHFHNQRILLSRIVILRKPEPALGAKRIALPTKRNGLAPRRFNAVVDMRYAHHAVQTGTHHLARFGRVNLLGMLKSAGVEDEQTVIGRGRKAQLHASIAHTSWNRKYRRPKTRPGVLACRFSLQV